MKLKRILAGIIDWILCGIPSMIYAMFFKAIMDAQEIKVVYILIFVFAVLLYPALFVLRDILFKGRSIAKRIFGLHIIDNKTKELPSWQKLIIRNLFFFIYPINAILIIVINQSVGDMATNTTVVGK